VCQFPPHAVGVADVFDLRGRDLWRLVHGSREGLRNASERIVVCTHPAYGAAAAEELDAHVVPDLFEAPDKDGSDFAGEPNVSATARDAVEILNGHDAKRAVAV